MPSKRDELKYQKYILDSYEAFGGYGRKWASEWTVGNPDLVLAFPGAGAHYAEVKHRPDWVNGKEYKNPLDDIQVHVARRFINAGARVIGMVLTGGENNVLTTHLHFFKPLAKTVVLGQNSVPYVKGAGYNIKLALEAFND